MLGDKTVTATIAVKDMDAAKKFYGEVLGFTKDKEDPSGIFYKSGPTGIFVYPSGFAGTNKATYAAWAVGEELERIIEDLKGKGVKFEQYDDLPGVTRNGDVHVMGQLKAAWFKDPDGNILNLVNQM